MVVLLQIALHSAALGFLTFHSRAAKEACSPRRAQNGGHASTTSAPDARDSMREAIMVAAAIILIATGVVLVNSRNHSAAPSSPQSITTFELMSKARDLPAAPHPDAF